MAGSTRRYSEYIDGSAARKLRERRPETYTRPEDEISPEQKQHIKRRKRLNIMSVIVMAAAIITSLYLCISYIMVYSEITGTSKAISRLRSEITETQAFNDEAHKEIDASLNLEDVYEKATKEYGMVPADKSQIYKYSNKKSDRVIKYSDIPE